MKNNKNKGKKEFKLSFSEFALVVSAITVGSLILGAGHHLGNFIVKTHKENEDKKIISEKIVSEMQKTDTNLNNSKINVRGYHDFEIIAIKPIKSDNNFFIEIYGRAYREALFTSFNKSEDSNKENEIRVGDSNSDKVAKFQINEELYNKITDNLTISYKYYPSQLNPIYIFGNRQIKEKNITGPAKANREEWSIYDELAEIISKQPCLSIVNYADSDLYKDIQSEINGEMEAQNSAEETLTFTVREKLPDEITVDDIINEQITGQKPATVERNF